MKNSLVVFGIIAAIVVVLGGWIISQRNALIALDEDVNEAWSNIDTDLQRRNDLIPNLVATVKGYATHEEEVFTGIADARGRLAGATTMQEKAEADAALTTGLGRLLAIAENYPELKANEGFLRLQDELAGTENRIKVTRKRYNEDVKRFNRTIRQFPGSLFAGNLPFVGLNLEQRDYFEPPQGHEAVVIAPKVQF
ncbi:MAG: LemA family protein [Lentisphaeria bacterium]|jgi:LemA protein|nr:LemA family protein [Lentisphaeria bacterium]MDD6338193.1 LemA family protein [Lentisphaeria bacterium]